MDSTEQPAPRPEPTGLPVLLTLWCSFFLYSAIAAPVPAVNEPHYLCKARHFWQPDWCANDMFLQSANAHIVFYATVGGLTPWLSLEQSAWVGRALAILILTFGWWTLMSGLSTNRWFSLYVCWLFLVLASFGNFSGEWLFGGVEGKVFSYGFLFAALGQFHPVGPMRTEFRRALLGGSLAGLAVSFHPVIGIWGLLAFAGTIAIEQLYCRRIRSGSICPARPEWLAALSGLGALTVCALPGLIPAVQLITQQVPDKTGAAANFIQVYYRLAHHLDPMTFLPRAYAGYALLIVVWSLARRLSQRTTAHHRFNRIVAFSILFALVGIIIGWGPRPAQQMSGFALRAQLLKFYPFRLADLLVPLAASVAIVNWTETKCWGSTVRQRGQLAGFGALFAFALFRAHANIEVNRFSDEVRADWIDSCRWIERNLPADALVHTPHNGWAFKWFAQRAEYVAFKDCPQDAAGIVEWNRRLSFLKRWFEEHYADKLYSADELRQFRAKTKITHILTDRLGPMELDPIYKNETFQVYDLTSLD